MFTNMSKLPALTLNLSDSDIAKESKGLLLALKFPENAKHNFESLLTVMRSADVFLFSPNAKKKMYLVGFSRSVEQARLAMAVMEEMRITSWTYLLFANGRIQLRKPAMLNVLDCFATASRLKDHTIHCHRTFDIPRERFITKHPFSLNIADVLAGKKSIETTSWKLPCQQLDGHLHMSNDEFENPLPYIEAAAERRLVNACPYYDSAAFEIIDRTHLEKPKRYW